VLHGALLDMVAFESLAEADKATVCHLVTGQGREVGIGPPDHGSLDEVEQVELIGRRVHEDCTANRVGGEA